jgi:hypothetical protein
VSVSSVPHPPEADARRTAVRTPLNRTPSRHTKPACASEQKVLNHLLS